MLLSYVTDFCTCACTHVHRWKERKTSFSANSPKAGNGTKTSQIVGLYQVIAIMIMIMIIKWNKAGKRNRNRKSYLAIKTNNSLIQIE